MYAEAIAVANETLAANKRVLDEAAKLRADANALLVKYRRHRFSHVSGGSDAADRDCVRARLGEFCAGGRPKSFVGYSRGSVCQACGSTIKPGNLEYDLVTASAELRVDGACYAVFVEVQSAMPGAAAL